jgi:type II secretory pathway component GspD/PulD (secretin)
VREFQGVVTMTRSITNLRWAFTYNAPRAYIVRGTPGQMQMTEWLLQQLDEPAGGQSPSSEYRVPGSADDVVHVYKVSHVDTYDNLQAVATVVRSIGNIRMVFETVGPPLVVATRGTAAETALADWLSEKLDQPTAGPPQVQNDAGRDFYVLTNGDTVRVFYLRSATVQAFQNVAAEIRTAAHAPQVITYNALGALVVRGTADQIQGAQGLIDERLKASAR